MSVADAVLDRHAAPEAVGKLPAHVVMLTNFIPPYRLPVYTELANRVEKLTILLSTPMEPNRSWRAEWGELDVRVQRTFTVRRLWRHAAGFRDTLHVHVPVDTLAQLRVLRPDVILSAELGFRSLFSGVYARHFRQTPLVLWLTLSEHTEQGRGRLRQALRRWLMAKTDTVVVNGSSGERYVKQFGLDRQRIFRVPYTALPELFDRLPLVRPATSAHRLLYVGQLIERKGLAQFITALAAWASEHPRRHVAFDIVGSGPLREKLVGLPRPANLSINFLGERDYRALSEIYASSGIFVLPTLADEWGLVVNEAMSAGLPVLGSLYSQAVEELCRDGESGWTFRPDSPSETLSAIDRALSADVDELDSMRFKARETTLRLTPGDAVNGLMPALEMALNRAKTFGRAHQPEAQARRIPLRPSLALRVAVGIDGESLEAVDTPWPPKLDLFGVGLSATNYDEAVELILKAAANQRGGVVACQAVHAVVTAARDPKLRERVNSFELVTPDGQPVRWALNWLYKTGLTDRVYGPELMLRLCGAAAYRGVSVYLYGGTADVLDALAKCLTAAAPGLRIAGREAPPFRPLSDEEDAAVVERINRSGAGIVFVGLGCPKQDHFAFEHRQRLHAVQVCVGAAFDFHAGVKPMAPAWMQRRGLEWLFRLACEPRRLARRYLTTNTLFVVKLAKAMVSKAIGKH